MHTPAASITATPTRRRRQSAAERFGRRVRVMISLLAAPLVATCIGIDNVGPGNESGVLAELSPAHYDTARLGVGDAYYVDRSHTITSLGPGLANRLWIRTANDDKSTTVESFISFDLLAGAHVVVGYDASATSIPDWLVGWEEAPAGIDVTVPAPASPLRLFHKLHPPGPVSLGGNLASGAAGAQSMYVVMLLRPSELGPVAIDVEPSGAVLDPGASVQFTATVVDPLGRPLAASAPLQWSATGGTITSEGLYTAGETPGAFQVTATQAGAALSTVVGVTIRDPGSGDTSPPVVGNGQPTGTLAAGTTQTTMSVVTNEAATCKWGSTSSTSYADLANTFTTTGGTSHATTLTGLTDGQSYTRYVRCQDGVGNANGTSYTISFNVASPADVTPPVISNGQPTGTLAAGTTQATMSVTTNEAATCKWGTSSSDSYADLTNTFTTTGGTAHSTTLTGLTDGQSYTRYVRCQDGVGNANGSSYTISFGVASPSDNTSPVISSGQPSGTLPAGTTQTTMSVATNEAATCKWGTSASTAYADLANTFATTGGTTHSTTLTGLADGQSYTRYVRCQDGVGNANGTSYTISFSVASPADVTPPVISNGQPTGTLAAGTTQATMSVVTNEAATCKWGSTSSTSYAVLANTFTTTGGTSHSTTLTGLTDGQSYTRYVRCQDGAGNANGSSYTISFSVASPADVTPPVVSNGAPTGTLAAGTTQTTMRVTTNEAATCRWGTSSSTSYADLANTFTTTGGTSHTTTLTGLVDGQSYTRYVRCRDGAGNANGTSYTISFSIANPSDVTPPVISNGQPTGTLAAGTTQATISVTTSEAATCRWGTSSSTSYALLPNTFTTTGGTAHSTSLTGLTDGQSYTRYVRCQDSAGNANGSSYTINFSIASSSASLSWACTSRIEDAVGSDLWPITWSNDDHQYAAWGDGAGFQGTTKRSYGIARIEGNPENYVATDLVESAAQSGGGKISGIISLGGVLYMWFNSQDGQSTPTHQLIKSTNKGLSISPISGQTWPRLGAADMVPAGFVNQGRDNADAIDGYVYHIAADWLTGDRVYLLRVPVAEIENPAAYEVFSGTSTSPAWSSAMDDRQPIYSEGGVTASNGASHTTITLIPELGEFMLAFHHADDVGKWSLHRGPSPWGPWIEIAHYENWCGLGGPATEMLFRHIAPRWIAPAVNGAVDFWMIWSAALGGDGGSYDRFVATKGTLRLP